MASPIERSPLEDLLDAVDRLDLDGMVALLQPDCRMRLADGREGTGRQEVTELLRAFFGTLRATSHKIVTEWHQGDDWIAEVEATYESLDRLLLKDLPRAVFLHTDHDGISSARFYGAHEPPLTARHDEPLRVGGRWILPL